MAEDNSYTSEDTVLFTTQTEREKNKELKNYEQDPISVCFVYSETV